jgi:hypothetical protein
MKNGAFRKNLFVADSMGGLPDGPREGRPLRIDAIHVGLQTFELKCLIHGKAN